MKTAEEEEAESRRAVTESQLLVASEAGAISEAGPAQRTPTVADDGAPAPSGRRSEEGTATAEPPVEARPVPRRFGRYELRRELGRGGVGVVWEAWDPKLGRAVALKTLLAGDGASEAQLGRFLREVRAAAGLRHPHIVPVHDAGEVEGRPYLTMDLVDGRSLDQLLTAPDPPAPRRVVELLVPIVRALSHAHGQGIVHRDVKPENILVDQAGHPYLTDFGLARDLSDATRLTRTDQTVGTPAFMAPEQLRGRTPDPRMDVYGLGATLYEALVGRVPFEGESFPDLLRQVLLDEPAPPRLVNPRVARDLEAIVLVCLEKDPARRYPTAAALAEDLERFLAGEAVQARAPSLARRLIRRGLRHRAVVVGLVIAAAGLVLGGAAALWAREQGASERRRLEHLEEERRRLIELRTRDDVRRVLQAEALLAPTIEGQLAAYERLLGEAPDAWDAHVARARLLRARGRELRARRADLPGARAALEEALRDLAASAHGAERPAPLLLFEAELVRTELHDPARARAIYEALARHEEGGGLSSYASARLCAQRGDHGEAVAAVDSALALEPDLAPARLLRAELLLREHPALALEGLDGLAGLTEAEGEVALLRGRALLALDDFVGAQGEANRAVELDPTDAEAFLVLGEAQLGDGEAARAARTFERARGLLPGDLRPLRLLARALTVAGRLDLATKVLEELRALEGGPPPPPAPPPREEPEGE